MLFSSQALTEPLALALYRVAAELYRTSQSAGALELQLAHGEVRNQHKHVTLAGIGGPLFEATVETERGTCEVRFLLTREGAARAQAQENGPPRWLN